MNIAAFDLETNGYPGTSVLSASSIVFDEAGRLLAFFNRFYLPTETFNRWRPKGSWPCAPAAPGVRPTSSRTGPT